MASAAHADVPYTSHAFVQTHPRRLSTVAWLVGLDAPDPRSARVLELGCASGGNLLPLACEYPDASFLGVDLSATSIAEGKQAISELRLNNVELVQADLATWEYDGPPFDYIVAHGLYSWVPAHVRERILAICRRHLNRQGVAYISYNTQPGWSLRGVLRDFLRFGADGNQDSAAQTRDARQLLQVLAAALPPGRAPQASFVQHEIQRLAHQPDDYLFHEFLASTNEPLYFREFVADARRHDLRYLGESEYSWMSSNDLPPEVAQSIRARAKNQEEFEQYLDFVRWQLFRQTLLCHAEHELSRNVPPERMYELYLAAELKIEGLTRPLGSEEVVTFLRPKSRMSTSQPITKAALVTLAESWPRWWSFDELLRASLEKLNVPADHGTPIEHLPHASELAETLRRAYGVALLDLARVPPRVSATIDETPQATVWARRQAERIPVVPNVAHQSHSLQGFQRFVLTLLDGRRTHEQLLDEVTLQARDSVALQDAAGQPLTDVARVRDVLRETLERTLLELKNLGYLVLPER